MRKVWIALFLLFILARPAAAMDYTAPLPPEDALELMPVETDSFGKDLWKVVTAAIAKVQPEVAEAAGVCLSLFASVMLLSMVKSVPGKEGKTADLVGVLAASVLLLRSTQSMVALAADTVAELSEYGKLLLPVMAAALASQGGITTSTALYTGTAVFDAVLSAGIAKLLVPMVYIFLTLAVAAAATGEKMLENLRDMLKWLVTWCLKTILTVFTAYISVTGVVSGTTDAATLKATKLTMSGMIPVVGGILSDASEAVIVGAGVVKNAVGVYAMVALIAMWIAPFLQIGVQYLLLKLTSALCGVFEVKPVKELIGAFSTAMGLLLGMTGAVCVLLLISVVCFMKGVA